MKTRSKLAAVPEPSTTRAEAATDRRTFLGGLGVAAIAGCKTLAGDPGAQSSTGAAAVIARPPARPLLVGSANGLAGMREVWEAFAASERAPLDCAIAVAKLQEADPDDNSVGLGGLPNEDGVVQLDAACMHGPTHNSGAVAALENILHPSEVARLVMERTDHCLLVGRGAYEFARAHGHEHVELLTEASRRAWMRWRETHSEGDDWLPPPSGAPPDVKGAAAVGTKQARAQWVFEGLALAGELDETSGLARPWGTVHCSALSTAGELACCTSTSGLAFKIPGRVGDSPIVGAGLYCDQEAGSAGGTGRGESAILANASFAIVELLRQGMSPLDAGLEVLRRVVRQTERQAHWQPGLIGADGKPAFGLHLYVAGLDGSYAGVTLKGKGQFAVADERGGPRHEPLVALLG